MSIRKKGIYRNLVEGKTWGEMRKRYEDEKFALFTGQLITNK